MTDQIKSDVANCNKKNMSNGLGICEVFSTY